MRINMNILTSIIFSQKKIHACYILTEIRRIYVNIYQEKKKTEKIINQDS